MVCTSFITFRFNKFDIFYKKHLFPKLDYLGAINFYNYIYIEQLLSFAVINPIYRHLDNYINCSAKTQSFITKQSMKNVYFLLILILSIHLNGLAQKAIDTSRINNFKAFCNYLKKTDSLKLDTNIILERYAELSTANPNLERSKVKGRMDFFMGLCKGLKKGTADLMLDQYEAMPTNKYVFKNPKDLELFKGLIDDKNQVYVYFLKEKVDEPLGFLLFAPSNNKIISWILLNESGTVYFLTLN